MTEDKKLRDKTVVKRRRFIKTTSTAAGVGAINLGFSSVKARREGDRVQFVDAGYEHDLHDVQGDVDGIHIEEFTGHVVKDDSKLELLDRMPTGMRTAVKRQRNIVRLGSGYNSYTPFSAGPVGVQPSRQLTTELDEMNRSIFGVEVAEPYAPPAINLKAAGNSVNVASEGQQGKVASGEERSFTLPRQQVEVVSFEPTGETRTSNQEGQPAQEYEILEPTYQSVEVTPRLVARNYGELEVVK